MTRRALHTAMAALVGPAAGPAGGAVPATAAALDARRARPAGRAEGTRRSSAPRARSALAAGRAFPRRCALVALLALPAAVTLASGDPSRVGPEFPVSSGAGTSEGAPAVAMAGDGSFMVVWESEGLDGSGSGIFGRVFGSMGSPVGSEFQVNSYTTGDQTDPSVAATGSGFVVVWASADEDGSGRGIFGRRFTASGAPAGAPFAVNVVTLDDQIAPSVASGGEGSFVVAWFDDDRKVVLRRRYDASGAAQGGELAMTPPFGGSEGNPAAAMHPSGSFVVAYAGRRDAWSYIWQQSFTDRGQIGPVGSAGRGDSGDRPALSMDPTGAFTVVWDDYDVQNTRSREVFARRYSSLALPVGEGFRVNGYTTLDQTAATVARSADGAFVVLWQSEDQDGSGQGVYGRRYDAAGQAIEAEFRVAGATEGGQETPSVAGDAVGNFVAVWRNQPDAGSGDGEILAQRFCGLVTLTAPHDRKVCAGGTASFGVAATGQLPLALRWRRDGVPLSDGGGISGAASPTLTLSGVGPADAGLIDCTAKDACSPEQAVVSAPAQLEVDVVPGPASGLRLAKADGGAMLELDWDPEPGAEDYVVYQDTSPGGAFLEETGETTGSVPSLSVTMPTASRFFLVAARNSACGAGPKH